MAQLSVAELIKYDWRLRRFIEKYIHREQFVLAGGQKVNLLFEEEVFEKMLTGRYTDLVGLEFFDAKIQSRKYRITSFKKTTEFGGVEHTLTLGINDELRETNSINNQLNQIRSTTGAKTVPIRIKLQTYPVLQVNNAANHIITLIDENQQTLTAISHRPGTTPHTIEWIALTKPEINKHREVQYFIETIKKKYQEGMKAPGTVVGYRIHDIELKKQMVYGVEYGNLHYSADNVAMVLQGLVRVIRDASSWSLTAPRHYDNGDPVTGSYEPILVAYFDDRATDFGMTNTKVVCVPISGRNVTLWLT
jgi:hypothetical protein